MHTSENEPLNGECTSFTQPTKDAKAQPTVVATATTASATREHSQRQLLDAVDRWRVPLQDRAGIAELADTAFPSLDGMELRDDDVSTFDMSILPPLHENKHRLHVWARR
jgi:hypothetical protein